MFGAEWGLNPPTIIVSLNVLMLAGVVAAFLQFRIGVKHFETQTAQLETADAVRRAQIFFKMWDKYEDAHTLRCLQQLGALLDEYPCKTLEEFNTAVEAFKSRGNEGFDADEARRLVKFTLAPLGYLLKFGIASKDEVFHVVPAAIRLWGKGLREVELQLMKQTGGERAFALGYDPVAMVDLLYHEYCERVDRG